MAYHPMSIPFKKSNTCMWGALCRHPEGLASKLTEALKSTFWLVGWIAECIEQYWCSSVHACIGLRLKLHCSNKFFSGRTNGCWPPAMPSLQPDMSIGFSTKWKHEDDRGDEFIEITLWAGILGLKTDEKCHLPPLATPGEWNVTSSSFIFIFGFPNLSFWRQCLHLHLNNLHLVYVGRRA